MSSSILPEDMITSNRSAVNITSMLVEEKNRVEKMLQPALRKSSQISKSTKHIMKPILLMKGTKPSYLNEKDPYNQIIDMKT